MFLVSMPLLCEPNDAVRAVAVAKRREYFRCGYHWISIIAYPESRVST